jgi:hypothetical protein
MARHTAEPKVNVTLAVDYEFVRWADEMADRTRSTRSQVIRDCAAVGRKTMEKKYPPKQAPVSAGDLPFPQEQS